MTIQEELRRDFRTSTILGLASWLTLVIIMANNLSEYQSEMILCAVIFATSLIFRVYFIVCPKCVKSISLSAIKNKKFSLVPDFTYKLVDDKCRACGCDFLQDAKTYDADN